MCKPISGIILKDRILFSNTEHSHSEILRENDIQDITDCSQTPNFVRAELYPMNGDMFSNIINWKFNVDQDIVPEWFVRDYEETRMRDKTQCYITDHIHIGKTDFILSDGLHWVKDCQNVILKGSVAIQELRSSTVNEMRESSTVNEMRGLETCHC